jgi:hypothetical protein
MLVKQLGKTNLRSCKGLNKVDRLYHAATFAFLEDTGTATSSHGTTRTNPATDLNWKNSGVVTDVYSSFPITANNNSFQKALYGKFTTGTFNNILGGLWAHITTAFADPTHTLLKGLPACTTSGGPWTYTTPSAAADAALTTDMTAAIAIASGVAVWFGPTGPETASKAATQATGADQYTSWLTTQLQTLTGAPAGDTATLTLELQYSEN